MFTKDQIAVFNECIEKYGAEAQIDMAIEEMSELTKALLKKRRGKGSVIDITDEMADVRIMLKQLEMIFDNKAEVEERAEYKVSRQKQRLKKEDKE